jgi:hypothetical protein
MGCWIALQCCILAVGKEGERNAPGTGERGEVSGQLGLFPSVESISKIGVPKQNAQNLIILIAVS